MARFGFRTFLWLPVISVPCRNARSRPSHPSLRKLLSFAGANIAPKQLPASTRRRLRAVPELKAVPCNDFSQPTPAQPTCRHTPTIAASNT
ncbi:uncharacterized protein B0I36DRAFT_329153 [Microdochium trichocladiopsis]|uniref:Secreted protein n=1 Tax=Microdochium trichocladiopsis TaxID=1682393 RepID=A0A9P9BQE8_9PEZI|nr:uncharacterized protein B0I36DRAFT_329153 [Microdochium trichocladiopsis]KAH7025797.1 hypothetical protein B0I36DRAFT_329153 [Microdochium trichocladiopsis]